MFLTAVCVIFLIKIQLNLENGDTLSERAIMYVYPLGDA